MGRIQSTPGIQTANATGTPNHPGQHVAGQQVPSSYPQNYQTVQPQIIGNPWQSGLFDCHQDPTNVFCCCMAGYFLVLVAVMTALFPCVTFGQIAEVMDASQPSQPGSQLSCPFGSFIYLLMMGACSQCVIGSKYRTNLRNRYGLVEAPYQDSISHLFCPFCSLCQEFRELKSRQLDPALGWQGILAQRQAMQFRNDHINKPPQPQSMSM